MLNKNVQKIVIAGDGGTGKSTLLSTKDQGCFCSAPKITIGVDFKIIDANKCDTTTNSNLLCFDLGGQKRFQFIHDSYIKGTTGAIVLYDLTREKTFENLPRWINLLRKDNPQIKIIIAGTKKDLTQPEDFSNYSRKWTTIKSNLENPENIIDHLCLSSKSFEGVEEVFRNLSNAISDDQDSFLRAKKLTIEPAV